MAVENLTTAEKWDYIYRFFNIKDFMDFVSSSAFQAELLPAKVIFIFFTAFFLSAVIYFYFNSSYIRYQFLEDVTEFFSWQPYGLRVINRRWRKIIKRTETGTESEYKLAIMEADDFLYQTLEERGYEGETLEDLANKAGIRILPNLEKVLEAHKIRNALVYDVNYRLDIEKAKEMLADYESAIKNVAGS